MKGKILSLKGILKQKAGQIYSPKETIYREALTKKTFLLGEPDEMGIDWTHFDFMIATLKNLEGSCYSYLDILKLFWTQLYPYFEKVIGEYDKMNVSWHEMVEDQDSALKNFAKTATARKLAEAYITEKGIWNDFQSWKEHSSRSHLQEESSEETKGDS